MKKVTQFDNVILRKLREEIDSALKGVGEKYGLQLKAMGCTYEPTLAKYKLEVATTKEDGKAVEKIEIDLERYREIYGLSKEDTTKVFKYHGEDYKIAGINVRKKFPIIIRPVSGKGNGYCVSENQVKILIQSNKLTLLSNTNKS
jgi:ribosomal protein L6P/L9E